MVSLMVILFSIKWFLFIYMYIDILTLSQTTNLDSSNLEEFAYGNFEFDGYGRKLSKRVENTAGKGEIARHEQFHLFRQCFQKTCTADT